MKIKDATAGAFASAPRPPETTVAKVARQNRDITALLSIAHTVGTSYGINPPAQLNLSKKRTASGVIKESSRSSTIDTTTTATLALVRSATMPSSVASIGPFLHGAQAFPTTTSTPPPAQAIGDGDSTQQRPAVSPMSAIMSRQPPTAPLPQQPMSTQPTPIARGRRMSVVNHDFSKNPKADPFRNRKSLGKASAGRDQFPQTAPVIRRTGDMTDAARSEEPCSPENSSHATSLVHPSPSKPTTNETQGADMDSIPTMPKSMRPVLPTQAAEIPVATPWIPQSARASSAVSSTPSVAPVAPMTPADFMPLDVKFTIPADHGIDRARDPRRAAGMEKTRVPRKKIQEPIDVIALDD